MNIKNKNATKIQTHYDSALNSTIYNILYKKIDLETASIAGHPEYLKIVLYKPKNT